MLIKNSRELGVLLRNRRRTNQLSQQALAEAIGVSRHWVIDLERGKPTLEVGLVLRAITALGLTTDIREAGRRDEPAFTYGSSSIVDLGQVLSNARGRSLAIAQRTAPNTAVGAEKQETTAKKARTRKKKGYASDEST